MRTSLYGRVVARSAFDTALRTTNSYNGTTIDRSYQNNFFRTSMFVIQTGTLTDGSITFVMEESDNGSSWSTVEAQFIQGTLPTIAATDDNKIYEIGYVGSKRYIRLVATVAAGATGGTWGAICLNSDPRRKPVTH